MALDPRRVCCSGAGTGGGGLLPQTAASGNVSQLDPESFMKYPGYRFFVPHSRMALTMGPKLLPLSVSTYSSRGGRSL